MMGSLKNFIHFACTYAGPLELIKRFLELMLGYFIYPFSYLFPRNDKKWVFGTNVAFVDNAKYLYLYSIEQKEVHAIWITNKRHVLETMKSLNLEVYLKWSFKGLWHCLTAGRYIFTNHSNDINFFTVGKARKVELWHGVGIKDSSSGEENKERDDAIKSVFFKFTTPHNYEKFDLFLSTGPLMNKHFTKLFNLSDEVLFEGAYPRCCFIQQSLDKIEEHVNKYETEDIQRFISFLQNYDNVYLYMPTWRADLKDRFLEEAGFDFEFLNSVMKQTNSLFLLKLHPAVKHHKDYKNLDSLIFLDSDMDIYSILPFTQVLITDYSSIYYDYLLMQGKKVILFPFDYNEYIKTSKSLAFDYDSYTPGFRVYSFKDLVDCLFDKNIDLTIKERDDILTLFWGENYLDKNIMSLYTRIREL